jgi:hypothetical protein
VFPPAVPRATTGVTTGAAVGLAVVAGVAGAALSLLRHPGRAALDTVWAEDGSVFLAGAVQESPLTALTTSYAGYYHAVPRLLAEAAAAVPPAAAAEFLAVAAAAVTALLAVVVYAAAAAHLHTPLSRLLVAAPVLVAPLAQQDVPNSVANLHWPALYAMFWVLVWTPVGRAGRAVAAAVVLLTAASDILVLAFLPLAAARLHVRRDRHSGLLAGLLLAGVIAQVLGVLTGSSSREVSLDPVRPLTGYLLRVVPSALLGERWLPEGAVGPGRIALAAIAWSLLAAVVVIVIRGRTMPRWPLAAVAAAHSIALYALPVVLTGVATPRYAFAPALLLLTALVATLGPRQSAAAGRSASPAAGDGRPRSHRVAFIVLVVLTVAVWLVNFRVETARDRGPSWDVQVEQARQDCLGSARDPVAVPISPDTGTWTVTLGCSYLTRR